MMPICSDGTSLLFRQLNRGKKSIAVNLKDPVVHEKLLHLIKDCDVLIEQNRPGTMKEYNLDYDSIKSVNPRLVYCSLSSYGQDGPCAKQAAHDIMYMARTGLVQQDLPDVEPRPLSFPAAAVGGGALPACVNIVAALYQRQTTHKGCYLDLSMMDGTFALNPVRVTPMLQEKKGNERVPENAAPGFSLAGDIPAYRIYKTKDGWLTLGIMEPKFFTSFLKAVGMPSTKEYVKMGLTSMMENPESAKLMRQIQQKLMERTTTSWMSTLGPLDICCAPVHDASTAALEDDQLKHRKVLIDVQLKNGEKLSLVKPPLAAPLVFQPRTCDPAPRVGENNDLLDQY